MPCAYPVYEVSCENKRLALVTDIHHCHGDWYETPSDDRMKLLCGCLKEAHAQKPFDAVVTLGIIPWIFGNTRRAAPGCGTRRSAIPMIL